MTARIGSACGLAALACLLAVAPLHAADDTDRLAAVSVSVRAARTLCFADRIEVTGTLGPREQVDVPVEREGLKVAQLLANPLDTVASGQVIARLAPLEGPGDAVPVRAPVSGVVLRTQAVVGQPATARQGPLFQIMAGGDVELSAEVTLGDLGRVAVGQAATVKPLGLPDLIGKVRRIEIGADPTGQVGRLRIGVGAGQEARVGTFARGTVTVGERCGIGVPYSAVQYEADGTTVQVVEGSRVETRQVSVGLLSGGNAEIRSGISESDMVVVRAGPFVREGDTVEPIVVRGLGPTPTPRR